MNQKTKQRWFALSSLIITFLLVKVFQDDLALAMKSDRPLEAGVESVRYSFAKWNYYFSDLWLQREINVLKESDRGKSLVSGSKFGYLNYQEKLVIPLILDNPHIEAQLESQQHIIARFNGKYGMVNLTGKVIIPFIYDRLEFNRYTQNIKAKKDDRWGIIDGQGKTVVPPDYDELSFLFDDYSARMHHNHNRQMYLLATKGDRQEVIDLENNHIAPFKVDRVFAHTPNITIVKKDEVIGFVNGNKFTPLTVDENGDYLTEGVAVVYYLNRYGEFDPYDLYCAVDRQGKILVSASTQNKALDRELDDICRRLNKARKPLILDKNSNQERELARLTSVFGRLTPILINNKYGYLNRKRELVIAPQFDKIGAFSGFDVVEYPW